MDCFHGVIAMGTTVNSPMFGGSYDCFVHVMRHACSVLCKKIPLHMLVVMGKGCGCHGEGLWLSWRRGVVVTEEEVWLAWRRGCGWHGGGGVVGMEEGVWLAWRRVCGWHRVGVYLAGVCVFGGVVGMEEEVWLAWRRGVVDIKEGCSCHRGGVWLPWRRSNFSRSRMLTYVCVVCGIAGASIAVPVVYGGASIAVPVV